MEEILMRILSLSLVTLAVSLFICINGSAKDELPEGTDTAISDPSALIKMLGTGESVTQELYRRLWEMDKWALMVGVNDYEDVRISDLRYAVPDVNKLHSILVDPSQGGFRRENVVLLTDDSEQKPTRRNIIKALKGLRDREGSLVLFYFSGHGVQLDGRSYLLPCDVDSEIPEDRGMPVAMIREMLYRVRVHSMIIILDACHSGGDMGASSGVYLDEYYGDSYSEHGHNVVIITSAGKNQTANEDPGKGHGVFTLALETGLKGGANANGDEWITAEELFPYARDWVREWVDRTNRQYDGIPVSPQDPFISIRLYEPVVISRVREARFVPEDNEPPQIVLEEPIKAAGVGPFRAEVSGHKVWLSGTVRDNSEVKSLEINGKEIALIPIEGSHPACGPFRFSYLATLPGNEPLREFIIRGFDQKGNDGEMVVVIQIPLPPELIPETVYVRAGRFLMGSEVSSPTEMPQHTVELSPYYIGIYEVTHVQFGAFIRETQHRTSAESAGHSYLTDHNENVEGIFWENPLGISNVIEGIEDHPVVHVSFYDAVAYCQWLSRRTGRHFRLPTEAEWERAARGEDGWRCPWGNEKDMTKANCSNGRATPVGSYRSDVSRIGCYDMAGNVSEWCADWYSREPDANSRDPKGPAEGIYKVVKGGHFLSSMNMLHASARRDAEPEHTADHIGFRVAIVP